MSFDHKKTGRLIAKQITENLPYQQYVKYCGCWTEPSKYKTKKENKADLYWFDFEYLSSDQVIPVHLGFSVTLDRFYLQEVSDLLRILKRNLQIKN